MKFLGREAVEVSVMPYDAVRARRRFLLRCALAVGMAIAIGVLAMKAGRVAGELLSVVTAVLERVFL